MVDLDGSEPSKQALRCAAGQAELSGADLRVVGVWQLPTSYGMPANYSDVDFPGQAREVLDAAIADALGTEPGITVRTEVAPGHPAAILTEESRGAALLVVGSRGHSAFTGMLLGPVSRHCAQHAACPVVIVRHQER